MSLYGIGSAFDECYIDRKTQVSGDLRASTLTNNTHCHGNFVGCDLRLLKLQEGDYDGFSGLKRLAHMKFTWNLGPEELKKGSMSDHNNHAQDYKLFTKMNQHSLIQGGALLKALHEQPNSILNTDVVSGLGKYPSDVLPDGTNRNGGTYIKVTRADDEEMTLYFEDITTKRFGRKSWAHWFVERRGSDGRAKNLIDLGGDSKGQTMLYSHVPVSHALDVLMRWKHGYGTAIGGSQSTGAVITAEQLKMQKALQSVGRDYQGYVDKLKQEKNDSMVDAMIKGGG